MAQGAQDREALCAQVTGLEGQLTVHMRAMGDDRTRAAHDVARLDAALQRTEQQLQVEVRLFL